MDGSFRLGAKLGAVQAYWWPCMGNRSLRVLGKQLNRTPRARVTNEQPLQPSQTNYRLCLARTLK